MARLPGSVGRALDRVPEAPPDAVPRPGKLPVPRLGIVLRALHGHRAGRSAAVVDPQLSGQWDRHAKGLQTPSANPTGMEVKFGERLLLVLEASADSLLALRELLVDSRSPSNRLFLCLRVMMF